jgi:hypothetical protein
MASGTIPEFYDYALLPVHITLGQNNQDTKCISDKISKNNRRYFWDGGILNNTPFRELLQAHQDYWRNAVGENTYYIPDLEVYVINLHPSKMKIDMIPHDYDGVKDRHNDIKYGDRNSHYDEKIANLVTDYIDIIQHLKHLAINHIGNKDESDDFQKDFEDLLKAEAKSKGYTGDHIKYEDLIKGRFELTKVLRIERTSYINSVYGKTNDLTEKTIIKLIKEGKCDAWVSLIKEDINNLKLTNDTTSVDDIKNIQDSLISKLEQVSNHLIENDYQNNEPAFSHLTEFIDAIDENKQVIDKLKQELVNAKDKTLFSILSNDNIATFYSA